MLETELYSLFINFDETERASFPKEENFVEDYQSDKFVREKIEQLLKSNSVRKLYAAVLLWEADRERSVKILNDLIDDKSEVLVQAPLDFRGVKTTIAVVARDFLQDQTIRGSNFFKEMALDNWALAIWDELRSKNSIEQLSLPKQIDVLDALADDGKKTTLLSRAEKLSQGTPSEKFYAVLLFENFDKIQAKQILESMLSDEKMVTDFSGGDNVVQIPAKEIAKKMLLGSSASRQETNSKTPNHSLLNWFSSLFGNKK